MSSGLDQRIDVALANVGLQKVLTSTSSSFLVSRKQAAAGLPDWENLRTRANEIKREAIDNLPNLLKKLESSVEARGGKVLHAANGDAACEAIAKIVSQQAKRLVVKSKSMATEEIELNHFLEEQDIETVETDLGEYIIQLAGEKPSHIVAPAIHKSRQDVAKLFREKLGVTADDDDIPGMTALARKILRQKFLDASVGISGVNFAAADTGTIAIIENEGNARLATSLPRVHIALMGIEKVIPRAADLPVFIKLLARSATGQKISTYTSFITGPRRAGETDGPEEFYLILLDNGRSKMLENPVTREALYCIRCGACLNVCPVYRKIGGHAYPWVYSGPIGAILSPQIQGLDAEPKLPFASSLCGACREVCPVKIRIPELLLELRHQEVERAPGRHTWERAAFRAWAAVMKRPLLYEIGGKLGRLFGGLAAVGPTAEWARTRELPVAPKHSFRSQWRKRKKSK